MSAGPSTSPEQRSLAPLLLCYAGMVMIAIAVNLPPVYLTTFSADFGGLSEQQLGWIGTMLFVGLTAGLLVSSPLADRLGAKTFVLLGNALIAGGLGLMAFAPTYAILLAAALVMGVGAGVLDMILSPIVAALYPHSRTSAMNWLHSFYAVGKIMITLIASLMMSLTVRGLALGSLHVPGSLFGWRNLCIALIAAPLIVLLGFWRTSLPPLVAENRQRTSVWTLLASLPFLVVLVAMFLAGATELGMAQWLPAYAEKGLGYPNWAGSQALTAFAVAMTLGRFAGGFLGRHFRPIRLLVTCCGLTTLLYLVSAYSPIRPVALLAGIGIGLSVSILWPTMLGITADRFPHGGAMMFGILAAAGNFGGVINFGIGSIAEHSGLRTAIASVAICPAILVLLLLWLALHGRRESRA